MLPVLLVAAFGLGVCRLRGPEVGAWPIVKVAQADPGVVSHLGSALGVPNTY